VRTTMDRRKRGVAHGVLALSALALCCPLAGCSSPIADLPSLSSADTSTKPKDAYLPVHDLPPDRDQAVIPPDQRAKIETDLIAARDHQAQASAAQSPAGQNGAAQTTTAQTTTAQTSGSK
jgi:hypothetical protein